MAFDAASGSSTTGTSLTWSHTCSGSNRGLFVHYVSDASGDVVTGITYAGVAMSFLGRVQSPSSRWTGMYYLAAPATGANNVVVSASVSSYIEGNAASYTGVLQTGNPEAFASNSGGSVTSVTGTVTTLSDNAWLVMGGHAAAGSQAAGTSTTRRRLGTVGAIFDSNGAKSPTGAYSLQQTHASTNASVIIASVADAGATNSITLTTPVQYKVFQRAGSTGSISITGTYTGTPTAIEASFNGGTYATIDAAPTGGSFAGTLTGQTQGQGTLTVRFTNDTGTATSRTDIGIGDVFVVCGDSISEGRGTNAQSYAHATLKAVKFTQADAWGNGNDGIDTGTSAGSHWPLLATQIMADQGVPVAFISAGTGSTDVAGSANTWAKPGTEYSGMTAQVTDSGVNAVKAVLMHLGPNAVVNASTLSKATYNAAIDTLAANIASDVAGAPKLHIGIFGEVTTGSPPDRRAAIDNLRGAIIEAHGDNSNVKPGPCLIDQDYSDGVHPQSDAALQAVAKRWWVALKESLYSGSGGRGPRLSSATWNGARTQLTVVFDRALKTGLSHSTAAWIVTDNGTPMTISSIAYHGSNAAALVLTMSAAATGGAGTSRVTFASGQDAVGMVVPLSADITMPSGAAIQIPAEPIYAATVAESLAIGQTITAAMSIIAGSASGQSNAAAAGQTVAAAASIISGAATGQINATAVGQTISATASLVPGSASAANAGTAAGATVSATASLLPGTATGQVNATAAGVNLAAGVTLIAGAASAANDATASGAVIQAAALFVAGAASGPAGATAGGATASATITFIAGGAYGPSLASTPGFRAVGPRPMFTARIGADGRTLPRRRAS